MSTLETILSRAMSEKEFADQLFTDADQALAGYDLSADEKSALKSMSRAEFDKIAAASPEERKSFGMIGHAVSDVIKNIGKGLQSVGKGG